MFVIIKFVSSNNQLADMLTRSLKKSSIDDIFNRFDSWYLCFCYM